MRLLWIFVCFFTTSNAFALEIDRYADPTAYDGQLHTPAHLTARQIEGIYLGYGADARKRLDILDELLKAAQADPSQLNYWRLQMILDWDAIDFRQPRNDSLLQFATLTEQGDTGIAKGTARRFVDGEVALRSEFREKTDEILNLVWTKRRDLLGAILDFKENLPLNTDYSLRPHFNRDYLKAKLDYLMRTQKDFEAQSAPYFRQIGLSPDKEAAVTKEILPVAKPAPLPAQSFISATCERSLRLLRKLWP